MNRQEALQNALAWAEGRRSWTNQCHALFDPTDPTALALREQTIAVMDAQEVVKWAALASVLQENER